MKTSTIFAAIMLATIAILALASLAKESSATVAEAPGIGRIVGQHKVDGSGYLTTVRVLNVDGVRCVSLTAYSGGAAISCDWGSK